MTSISERVARGVEWLDVNRPGWVDAIDLERLLLSSPCDCVLGQIDGNYFTVIWSDDPNRPDGKACGFNARDAYDCGGDDAQQAECHELEDEWRRVITSRREATDA